MLVTARDMRTLLVVGLPFAALYRQDLCFSFLTILAPWLNHVHIERSKRIEPSGFRKKKEQEKDFSSRIQIVSLHLAYRFNRI